MRAPSRSVARSLARSLARRVAGINSAIVKLGKLTVATKVYRGIAGKQLPQQFWQPNNFGVKGVRARSAARGPDGAPAAHADALQKLLPARPALHVDDRQQLLEPQTP